MRDAFASRGNPTASSRPGSDSLILYPGQSMPSMREENDCRGLEMEVSVPKDFTWVDLKPGHGFHELDFLPENERVCLTKAPEEQREVMERLLEHNFRRHGEEVETGKVNDSNSKWAGKRHSVPSGQARR